MNTGQHPLYYRTLAARQAATTRLQRALFLALIIVAVAFAGVGFGGLVAWIESLSAQ